MHNVFRKKKEIALYTSGIFTCLGYALLAYTVKRSHFGELFIIISLLFGLYIWIVNHSEGSMRVLLRLAFIVKGVWLLATPALSDDFYRFLWDGNMLVMGQNPYAILPSAYPNLPYFTELNSPNYYTVYPPVNQFIFGLVAWLSCNNTLIGIVTLRVLILLADWGNIYWIKKIASRLGLPPRIVLWYAFNPLIIVELIGNLHFEAIMIFFLLGMFYRVLKTMESPKTWRYTNGISIALWYSLAVLTKLIPLLLAPVLIRFLGWSKAFFILAVSGIIFALAWIPLIDSQVIHNVWSSVDLYFQKFEFNASIYYIIRALGFWLTGFNIIQWSGGGLGIVSLVCILLLAWGKYDSIIIKNTTKLSEQIFIIALFSFSTYYFNATTVHPWYITTIVVFSLFTSYRFVLIWSWATMMSYHAYRQSVVNEDVYWIVLEYCIIFVVLSYELIVRILESKHYQK